MSAVSSSRCRSSRSKLRDVPKHDDGQLYVAAFVLHVRAAGDQTPLAARRVHMDQFVVFEVLAAKGRR
jgi:hypothetical protein